MIGVMALAPFSVRVMQGRVMSKTHGRNRQTESEKNRKKTHRKDVAVHFVEWYAALLSNKLTLLL